MISVDLAKKQAMRLAQMINFPRDAPEAFRELALAIQAADTEAIAITAVSSFLETANSQTRCPMPAEIRTWIYTRQGINKAQPKCAICGGSGFRVVYQLVTYRSKSFSRQSQIDIPDVHNDQEAHAFQERIMAVESGHNDSQMVISAAKPCVCLPATHKLLTGERV